MKVLAAAEQDSSTPADLNDDQRAMSTADRPRQDIRGTVTVQVRNAILVIVLAVIEVVLTEIAIRSGLAGVERATTILFILILLNFALVLSIGSRRDQSRS